MLSKEPGALDSISAVRRCPILTTAVRMPFPPQQCVCKRDAIPLGKSSICRQNEPTFEFCTIEKWRWRCQTPFKTLRCVCQKTGKSFRKSPMFCQKRLIFEHRRTEKGMATAMSNTFQATAVNRDANKSKEPYILF